MGKQRVTFHLSEANATHLLATFDWLMCQNIVGACSSSLTLITDHVTEALIVDETLVDVDLHHFTLDAGVHDLVAVVVVAVPD